MFCFECVFALLFHCFIKSFCTMNLFFSFTAFFAWFVAELVTAKTCQKQHHVRFNLNKFQATPSKDSTKCANHDKCDLMFRACLLENANPDQNMRNCIAFFNGDDRNVMLPQTKDKTELVKHFNPNSNLMQLLVIFFDRDGDFSSANDVEMSWNLAEEIPPKLHPSTSAVWVFRFNYSSAVSATFVPKAPCKIPDVVKNYKSVDKSLVCVSYNITIIRQDCITSTFPTTTTSTARVASTTIEASTVKIEASTKKSDSQPVVVGIAIVFVGILVVIIILLFRRRGKQAKNTNSRQGLSRSSNKGPYKSYMMSEFKKPVYSHGNTTLQKPGNYSTGTNMSQLGYPRREIRPVLTKAATKTMESSGGYLSKGFKVNQRSQGTSTTQLSMQSGRQTANASSIFGKKSTRHLKLTGRSKGPFHSTSVFGETNRATANPFQRKLPIQLMPKP